MIKEISIALLLPAEMNTLAGRVLDLLQNASLAEAFVQRNIRLIQASREILQATLSRENGNPLTAQLSEKDKARDKAFVFLRDFIRTSTQHPDPETSTQAAEIWIYFEKYGITLHTQSYAKESSSLDLLFGDLDKPGSAVVLQKLGASMFYEMLKKAQEEFETTYKQKVDLESSKTPLPLTREAQNQTGKYLIDLFGVLEVIALSEENPTEKTKVEELIARINEVIQQLMTVARSRRSKNNKGA